MAFVKGDPRINRNGRPKNAEADMLRKALAKQGEKHGQEFWDRVAEYAFKDKNVMIAVIKKFVPDLSHTELTGADGDNLFEGVKMVHQFVIVNGEKIGTDSSPVRSSPSVPS